MKQCGNLHEVVPSVTDDQTKVALSCEINTVPDLILCCCHDDIASVEPSGTGFGCVVGRQAGVVRLERPELGNRVVSPDIVVLETM